jgi:large subunit ribosomal protein L24
MAKANFKKGDTVVVIAGDDKGKSGKLLKVDRKKDRVIVEGLKMQKKTVRRSQTKPQGGIEDREGPIHISNVMSEERYRARRSGKQK